MESVLEIRTLDDQEIDNVHGGVAGIILGAAALIVAAYGAAYAAGYQAGKDQAEKERRAAAAAN